MNNRIKVIIGSIIFIVVLIGMDRLLKVYNSVPKNTTTEGQSTKADTNNHLTQTNHNSVIEITDDMFEKEVLQSEKKVLIDFYATWCGPCQMLSPRVEEVAEEMPDVKFVKIDVDKEERLASEYGIYSIPTLIVIENGEEVERVEGLITQEQIKELIR